MVSLITKSQSIDALSRARVFCAAQKKETKMTDTLKNLADEYGTLCAQESAIKKRKEEIKAEYDTAYTEFGGKSLIVEGAMFRVNFTIRKGEDWKSIALKLDPDAQPTTWKMIAESLDPSTQLLTAHKTKTPVIRCSARSNAA